MKYLKYVHVITTSKHTTKFPFSKERNKTDITTQPCHFLVA